MKHRFVKLSLVAFLCIFGASAEAKPSHSKHHGKHHKKEAYQPKKSQKTAKMSSTAVKHIKDRHWYKANSGAATSHFNKSMTEKKLNELATKTLNKGKTTDSKQGNGRKVHEYKFKKSIGTETNGQKAKTLRVVTDGKNNVITAFPVR